jgi:hypothetical protein
MSWARATADIAEQPDFAVTPETDRPQVREMSRKNVRTDPADPGRKSPVTVYWGLRSAMTGGAEPSREAAS